MIATCIGFYNKQRYQQKLMMNAPKRSFEMVKKQID
jgi:hypothetical protein